MDPYIGKMLDNRYEILERIGTGGMAVVYKAKCHRLNRLVAVKILKSDLAQDADFRRRFNAESQAVAQLSHANIVSIYDVSRDGDIQYIVMELVDGITLKQYMEKRGKLNWREALHFITQIMRGLSHAHSRGIVHRDIKPQNIMILRDGSVKVADFGIACLENANQTLTQEALGSVHYISPEQARGDRIDARSDIYSAGVVLYEMLAGRLPFEGESAVSVAIQHLSSIPLAPREINPEIPEQLELICMKAMASDINHRYNSADEMIADLEAFRKDPSVDLDFELSDLRPEENDEPTQALHTASFTHAAAATSAAHRGSDRGEIRSREEDLPERRGDGRTLKMVLISVVVLLAAAIAFLLFRSIMASFHNAPPLDESMVPALYGYSLTDAQNHENVLGQFTIKVNPEPISSEEYDVDTIARQHPQPGEVLKGDNRIIEVWLSSGEATGEMPDITKEYTISSAKIRMNKLIEEFELTFDCSEEYDQFDDEIEKDYIISTIPAAGEPLHKGDSIHIVVSKGRETVQVPVPKFVGQKIDEVQSQLASFKLTCTDADIERVESEEEVGTIIWQSVDPAEMVDEGTTIKFRVSSGLKVYTRDEEYELPQDGRELVNVKVFVGDEAEPQYNETVKCSDEKVHVTLKGSGAQQVKVYFDDVLEQSLTHTIDFVLENQEHE